MTDFKTRANRGARVLDRIYPGWHLRINEAQLDIASTQNCVLGQLFREEGRRQDGSFMPGFSYAYDLIDDRNVYPNSVFGRLGFMPERTDPMPGRESCYLLTVAWREELLARQS
jgi:hypothetical protein